MARDTDVIEGADDDVGSIAIRKIPRSILDSLGASAKRNDRSLEAEARYALKAWLINPANDGALVSTGCDAGRVIGIAADLIKSLEVISGQLEAPDLQPSKRYKLTVRLDAVPANED